jgi:hypothetical protein
MLQQRAMQWSTEVLGRLKGARDGVMELAPGATSAGCLLFAVDTTIVIDDHPQVLSYVRWDLDFCSTSRLGTLVLRLPARNIGT